MINELLTNLYLSFKRQLFLIDIFSFLIIKIDFVVNNMQPFKLKG